MINKELIQTIIERSKEQIKTNSGIVSKQNCLQLIVVAKAYLKIGQSNNKKSQLDACMSENSCGTYKLGRCTMKKCSDFKEIQHINTDYSKYKCPYSHLEKDCGHELKGPEGYENTYGVWCPCGFRGPVFYLDPKDLNLENNDNQE